jgi:uncharacterized damage-inducible protein DinB
VVHRDALVAEVDQEAAATRLLIERLPEGAFGWKPAESSYSLGGLVAHLAELPHWGRSILEHDHHDVSTHGRARAPAHTTRAEVLEVFDRHVSEVRRILVGVTEGELQAPWSLMRGEIVIVSVPRVSAFRRFFVHHLVHHRGQLSVYMQLQNVPVPPMYGPPGGERP